MLNAIDAREKTVTSLAILGLFAKYQVEAEITKAISDGQFTVTLVTDDKDHAERLATALRVLDYEVMWLDLDLPLSLTIWWG